MKETHRYRVSFDFTVTIDTKAIDESPNDDEIKAYDKALLAQFLVANKDRLREALLSCVASELGWLSDDEFERLIIGDIASEGWAHRLFGPAIDALEDHEAEYWKEVRDMPKEGLIDPLTQCTENILACIDAKMTGCTVEDSGTLIRDGAIKEIDESL